MVQDSMKKKQNLLTETECLEMLKKSISNCGILQKYDFPEDFLLRFVRGKNNDPKSALDTLVNYVSIRHEKYSAMFSSHSNPESIRHVYESGMIQVLKQRDNHGRVVFIMRTEPWNVSKISVDSVIISILKLCEKLLESEETQIKGIVIIRDYQGFGFEHMKICTLSEVKKACDVFINSFPCKYKACHVIRNSYFFHLLLSMAKPFMPYKLKSRFFIHGMNMDSLHGQIPQSILPKFLGGNLEDTDAFDNEIFKNILNTKTDILQSFLK